MKKIIGLITILIISAMMVSAFTVERSMPSDVGLNEEVEIKVSSKDVVDKYFVIVRENIPSGWTYSSGGVLEENQVKFILSTLTSSSVTYKLTSPNKKETTIFSGIYQSATDSTPNTIAGQTQLNVAGGGELNTSSSLSQPEKISLIGFVIFSGVIGLMYLIYNKR